MALLTMHVGTQLVLKAYFTRMHAADKALQRNICYYVSHIDTSIVVVVVVKQC